MDLEKGSKKIINAWAFYDWANSVYPLVISSAIFPIYYGALFSESNTITFFQYELKNTAMISFVTAAAFFIVAFIHLSSFLVLMIIDTKPLIILFKHFFSQKNISRNIYI